MSEAAEFNVQGLNLAFTDKIQAQSTETEPHLGYFPVI